MTNKMKISNGIKVHIIIFILISAIIFTIYNFRVWKGVEREEGKVEITAKVTQNTISTGVTAVSILLPLTVVILGFTIRQNKRKEAEHLICACIFFTISLAVALFNLNRFPGIVNLYNIANDKPTVLLQVIQLFSLFYGVVYLVWGAWGIMNDLPIDKGTKKEFDKLARIIKKCFDNLNKRFDALK